MKAPLILHGRILATAILALLALPLVGMADDLTPPVVAKALPSLTISAGTSGSVINLKKTFGLQGVSGQIVRLSTVEGNIDIEMLSNDAPNNVANFLSYVNSGSYNKSFIHRSVPGFVIQGGGYDVTGTSTISAIPQNAPVAGEHMVSNTRGTLALALSTGPDSGTNQWFFNLIDNPGLDGTADGGPFTVFARVIEGDLATMDAIAALPVVDFSSSLGKSFAAVPLYNYSTGQATINNLVFINDAAVISLVPSSAGADAVLTLKVKNSNPSLVTAKITGSKLKLAYTAGQTGTATIKVFATDSAGSEAVGKFKVIVQ